MIRPHDLDRAERLFARWGAPAVFFGRMLPVIRTFISLPAMNTVDPVVSLVIGVAVYDEKLRRGVVALTAAAIGIAVILVSAVALSR